MANNKLKTEELDKVLDSVSSEEQLQEYLDRYTNKDGYGDSVSILMNIWQNTM